ncbi:hypothetical protein [Pimelobacter sp. 30-1]|uniref:hypothetical protein n=1 Tax=Pimelobacter sp. 30-1 TaxID=2004991 RepID=UPI001C03E9C5|nr:hypothetical protein [Pimelobacter sp. 30-1]MBU2694157.1 hypothetical protein [Pimelobacter sp. 30-1]
MEFARAVPTEDRYDGSVTTIAPDPRQAWVGLVFWWTRFFVVGVGLSVTAVVASDLHPVEIIAGLLVLVLPPTVVVGMGTVLLWRLGPGRVSYVVDDGRLVVLRGRKVLRRYRCADITQLEVDGAMTWKVLLLRRWTTAPWPRLVIDSAAVPADRLLVGPRAERAILLWGESRARSAEGDLRTAVVRHGATLSPASRAPRLLR